MNCVYLGCVRCKVFIDIGYRWAYCTLEETGIVSPGQEVDAKRILDTYDYWNPEANSSSDWLYKEVFPSVRLFLETHRAHRIIYGEEDQYFSYDDGSFLEWQQEGYLKTIFPKEFLENLKMNSWNQVTDYMNKLRFKPYWWRDNELQEKARNWFNVESLKKSIS